MRVDWYCLFGLLRVSAAIPSFSSGSTAAKDTVDNSAESAPDVLPMQHCGNWDSTSGEISSEHPYAAGFGCMYTVTSPEPIEFRIKKMELKVTQNCLFDNIQLYDGHKELGWICQADNEFMKWTNVDSGNLGVYFEGYSGKHYGFDLEWRSQIKTTTTTTTTTTAKKKRQSRKKKKRQRGKVGFIETVKRRYELLIKRREQVGGNQSLQSRIIEKFNKLVIHVFADQDRKSKLRPCYLPQGSSLENSDIPPLFLNQINSATTSTKIMSILTAIISRQDQLCRQTSRRRVTHPKRWLQWFDNRSTRLKERENMHFI